MDIFKEILNKAFKSTFKEDVKKIFERESSNVKSQFIQNMWNKFKEKVSNGDFTVAIKYADKSLGINNGSFTGIIVSIDVIDTLNNKPLKDTYNVYLIIGGFYVGKKNFPDAAYAELYDTGATTNAVVFLKNIEIENIYKQLGISPTKKTIKFNKIPNVDMDIIESIFNNINHLERKYLAHEFTHIYDDITKKEKIGSTVIPSGEWISRHTEIEAIVTSIYDFFMNLNKLSLSEFIQTYPDSVEGLNKMFDDADHASYTWFEDADKDTKFKIYKRLYQIKKEIEKQLV